MKKLPEIDSRTKEEIEAELLHLAAGYVPEWKAAPGDAGRSLVHIFSGMFEELLERFNRMPYKNYLYFLNLLGAEPLPAAPSCGYAAVRLTGWKDGGLWIPKGTRIYGRTADGVRIPFETCSDCRAVDSEAVAIYQVKESRDVITRQELRQEDGGFSSFRLFLPEGENIQQRRLILTESPCFNGTGASVIRIEMYHRDRPGGEALLAEILSDPALVCWEQKIGAGWEPIPCIRESEHRIRLELPAYETKNSSEETVERILACRLLTGVKKDFTFTGIRLGAEGKGLLPDSLYYNDLPLAGEEILPYGVRFSIFDDFLIGCSEAFSKKGAFVTLSFELSFATAAEAPVEKEMDEFPENGYRITRTGRRKKKVLFPVKEELPQEKLYRSPVRIVWEYFNGSGWAFLPQEEYEAGILFSGTRTGRVEVSFQCPEDMSEFIAGASRGLFLRARLLEVGNEYIPDAIFRYPVIRGLRIRYEYRGKLPEVSSVYLERDGRTEQKWLPCPDGEELALYRKEEAEGCACYIKFSNPIPAGPIHLFWKLKGRSTGTGALKFEAYIRENGVCRWSVLTVTDGTEGMRHSGAVTLRSRETLESLSLFGTDGYFFRITPAGKKTMGEYPEVLGLDLNVLRLLQQETMEPEYFLVQPGEINKLCELSGKDILEPVVWVDELESCRREAGREAEEAETEFVHGEDGRLLHRWVKWRREKSLLTAGPADRVYLADFSKGWILFGDGKHGRIPAILHPGRIRIDYRCCLGSLGNLPVTAILGSADPIPLIRSITCLEPLAGGCDRETASEAAENLAGVASHRNRAVSVTDYEVLAKRSDQNIARVKVYLENGGLKLVLLPKQPGEPAGYFERIRQNVIAGFRDSAPAVLTAGNRLKIQEAVYIEFCVHVRAELEEANNETEVYQRLEQRLNAYFHPITGDFAGEGFEIGKLPPRTKIFHFVKMTPGLRRILSLTVCCYERRADGKKELSYEQAMQLPGTSPISGTPTILLEAGRQENSLEADRGDFGAELSQFE